jgi:hypothetical protein
VLARSSTGFDGQSCRTWPQADLEPYRVDDVEQTSKLRCQLASLKGCDHMAVCATNEFTELGLREAGVSARLTDGFAELLRCVACHEPSQ